ncbi:enoyl-CoA hydratase/isomerase family protein [Saccharopolyspora sp. MS10]|uniref:enoyl-CoA hydratase/isomerase family protein n=1 Tax=Saccharopolyspora sp. MS10 TaxID=3385973 RepID=UPI0039A2AB88
MRAVEREYATLRVEQDGRVLTAFVAAPPHNYMTAAMQRDFVELVDAVERDRGVGAVVVTGGVPGRYITHYDIGHLLTAAEGSPPLSPRATAAVVRSVALLHRRGGAVARRLLRRGPLAGVHRLVEFNLALERILRSPAVWIAAVDGPCGGGGLEMSVFFDLRFGSEEARFVLPELSIGLSTTFGGRRLAQLVGPSRALELMLEARPLDAGEARSWGLVDEVVPGDVVAHAQRRAVRFARRPREVVAAQKGLFHDPDRTTAAESLLRELIAQGVGVPTERVRSALRRWLELQGPDGDSTFLTDPRPWEEGTAVDLVGEAP